MKKTIFVIISSQYYFKYLTNKSFKELERKYKVYYLFNEKNITKKNFKIKNKIFYKLNQKSSVWILYFLHLLRISNHKKCKTFKAATEWYFPNLKALKQIFRQEKIVGSIWRPFFKNFITKLIMNFLSQKYLYHIVVNYFFKKIHIEENLDKIFFKYKPDLVIYPTHSMEPELLKIQKLSARYNSKTFHIIDNWDNLSTCPYYEFKPNFIGVWGKQTKMHAVKIHNFKKNNVFLIGNCRFDHYFKLKKKNFKKLNRDYILFISCKIRVNEISYLKLLNKILTNNKKIFKNTKIIYRQHPQDKNLEVIKNLNKLENVIIDKTVFNDSKESYFKNDFNIIKKNYIPLMFNAKFITGCISSVIIEGLILNKSYLVIGFQKKIDEFFNPKWFANNFVHYEGLEKVDNVKFSLNEKQYEKMLIKMFKEQKKPHNHSKNLDQLDYFYHKDKLPYNKKILKIVTKII